MRDDKTTTDLRAAAGDALCELGWLATQVKARTLGSVDRARTRLREAIKAFDAGPVPIEACPVPGCVRIAGHPSFHCTSEQIAKREDGR